MKLSVTLLSTCINICLKLYKSYYSYTFLMKMLFDHFSEKWFLCRIKRSLVKTTSLVLFYSGLVSIKLEWIYCFSISLIVTLSFLSLQCPFTLNTINYYNKYLMSQYRERGLLPRNEVEYMFVHKKKTFKKISLFLLLRCKRILVHVTYKLN